MNPVSRRRAQRAQVKGNAQALRREAALNASIQMRKIKRTIEAGLADAAIVAVERSGKFDEIEERLRKRIDDRLEAAGGSTRQP